MNRQIPRILEETGEETNSIYRMVGKGILLFVIVASIVSIGSLLIVGTTIIGIPDLPTAQPVNVSIHIDSTNCAINISNVECTPSFSCEKFCPCENISKPLPCINETQPCDNIKIYRPILLAIPKMD